MTLVGVRSAAFLRFVKSSERGLLIQTLLLDSQHRLHFVLWKLDVWSTSCAAHKVVSRDVLYFAPEAWIGQECFSPRRSEIFAALPSDLAYCSVCTHRFCGQGVIHNLSCFNGSQVLKMYLSVKGLCKPCLASHSLPISLIMTSGTCAGYCRP